LLAFGRYQFGTCYAGRGSIEGKRAAASGWPRFDLECRN